MGGSVSINWLVSSVLINAGTTSMSAQWYIFVPPALKLEKLFALPTLGLYNGDALCFHRRINCLFNVALMFMLPRVKTVCAFRQSDLPICTMCQVLPAEWLDVII
jgi:hypothetical protein